MVFVPPTAGVFDAPAVSISLNVEWRSFVIGALESLLSSPVYGLSDFGVHDRHAAPVWTGDDDAVYAADQEIEKLLNALAKGQSTMLPGMVQMYLGTIAPAGWLLCDGSSHNQADYPALTAILPESMMDVESETFVTPDLRERFPRGAQYPVFVGEVAGSDVFQLSFDQLPQHHKANTIGVTEGSTEITYLTIPYEYPFDPGSGMETPNFVQYTPPCFALNFIIKT